MMAMLFEYYVLISMLTIYKKLFCLLLSKPCEIGIIVVFILQVGKLRLRENHLTTHNLFR